MMLSKSVFAFLSIAVFSCTNNAAQQSDISVATKSEYPSESFDARAIGQIQLPDGYVREAKTAGSLAGWISKVPLKKDGVVYLFDGSRKKNQDAQFAVLDISTGDENLQQCADAVMRIRAEYLYSFEKFDQIVFNDNAGTSYRFTAPYTRSHFGAYLKRVFGMCGSASLSKQLRPRRMGDMQTGDVFIRGGFPGHAVIVVDMAQNREGKKIFLLAQSYMPAQDIHILKNPMNDALSPWYELTEEPVIHTPEYSFQAGELKCW